MLSAKLRLLILVSLIGLVGGCGPKGQMEIEDDDLGDDTTDDDDDDNDDVDDDSTDDDLEDDDGADDDSTDDDDDGQDHLSSSQDWIQVAAGLNHACGLHQDGVVECWGESALGLTSPPGTAFSQISSSCGVLPSAEIRCWGDEDPSPPQGSYVWVDSEPGYCAIDDIGQIHCWGDHEQLTDPPDGVFVQTDDGCGTSESGTIHCWLGTADVLTPPDGVFSYAAGARSWACGIRIDGTGICWGEWYGMAGQPLSGGPFTQVDAVYNNACWLLADASVECNGGEDGAAGNIEAPLGASFDQISLGLHFGCGVRTDGRIQCWGDNYGNDYGQMDPP
jgi:hypothetical protein